MTNALAWAERAACRGMDLELFFTDAAVGVRQAKRICAACPVRQQCLEEALRTEINIRYGISGGLTPAERAEVARTRPRTQASPPKRKKREPAKCGTRGGYQKHLREKTQVCAPCRQANTDADNRLRRTGTTKART